MSLIELAKTTLTDGLRLLTQPAPDPKKTTEVLSLWRMPDDVARERGVDRLEVGPSKPWTESLPHASGQTVVGDVLQTGKPSRRRLTSTPGEPVRFLLWNVAKGMRGDVSSDLNTLIADADVAVLQEARGDQSRQLQDSYMEWNLGVSFTLGETAIPTGVLTGSRAAPQAVEVMRSGTTEFGSGTPKASSIQLYNLPGSPKPLAVVNVHALNFVSPSSFQEQLDALQQRLEEHDGPMVLAGDFNAWQPGRWKRVDAMAKALGLESVEWEGERTSALGRPIDGAYVRGGSVTNARVHEDVVSSDHRPMSFEFAVSGLSG